ncbi:hypothetical protein FRB90_006481 [Tulasnella sp. 427]|nr:hypothetical protein FRB90_006481 [Tulasnella sp. 427]
MDKGNASGRVQILYAFAADLIRARATGNKVEISECAERLRNVYALLSLYEEYERALRSAAGEILTDDEGASPDQSKPSTPPPSNPLAFSGPQKATDHQRPVTNKRPSLRPRKTNSQDTSTSASTSSANTGQSQQRGASTSGSHPEGSKVADESDESTGEKQGSSRGRWNNMDPEDSAREETKMIIAHLKRLGRAGVRTSSLLDCLRSIDASKASTKMALMAAIQADAQLQELKVLHPPDFSSHPQRDEVASLSRGLSWIGITVPRWMSIH